MAATESTEAAAETAAAAQEETLDAKEADAEEEEVGGLDDEEEFLTLKSGGQQPKSFEISKKSAELSKFVTTILEGDSEATSIEIRQVPPETLSHVIDYLKHHAGKEPDPLPCPVRSIHMAQIVSDKWDATWIDAFDKKTIFEIILAANYMDIKSLLHLGCAKIATLIKQLDQKEINRIIEEEEKYRREHAQNDAEAKAEEKDAQ
jgi:S-phase kinase-associated protein 1